MSNFLRSKWGPLGTLLLAVNHFGSLAQATAVRNAEFQAAITGSGRDVFSYSPFTLEWDRQWSNPDFHQYSARVSTSGGAMPMIDLQISTQRASSGASASLDYFFQVVPANPSAPAGIAVPLNITSRGSASVSGDYASAEAGVNYGERMLVCSAGIPNCPPNATSQFTVTRQILAFPGRDYQIHMWVRAGGVGTNEIQVVLDPLIQIDSSFADRDLFQVAFSPNLSTGSVPEPQSCLLAIFGLGAIAAYRFRRT